ncbi:MAG: carbohydrate kinase [Acidobacteriales bacterium]|nr:carbohydrate kinase [Terriglobales bacterium]
MPPPFRIAAIGELLWDLLPTGPQLGGAPANFASMSAHLAALESPRTSDEIFLISRVGNDALGRQAVEQFTARSINLDHISIDTRYPTGTVTVALQPNGNPTYTIHENAAWDSIPHTPQLLTLAPTLAAVCFGTLAQRSNETRATLRRFVASTSLHCVRVFDVNLRDPYWSPESLRWGCSHATVLKMNHEEVPHLAAALDAPPQSRSPHTLAQFVLDTFPVELVAITRGAEGSLLVTLETIHQHPGIPVQVADSIGAGDAFTAAITRALLLHQPLPAIAEFANRWGAWVATQHGGMPSPIPTP